jgi:hypothetical protein
VAASRPLSISIRAAAGAACLLALLSAAPAPVHAQGLFDLLNSVIRGIAPRAYRAEPPRLLENFPGGEYDETLSGPAGPHVSYCVRLCDGRYFPLPRNAGTNEQQMCSAMCPAAQTKIFKGSQVEHAVASDGKNYKSLANAFTYRERLVTDCTCNARDTAGIAQLDSLSDPTLRAGDIVVTAEGPVVFTGNGRDHASRFVAAYKARGLPQSLRKQLAEMRIAPARLAATVKSGGHATESIGAPARPALTMTPDGGDAQQGLPASEQN